MVEVIINETRHTTTVNLLESLRHFDGNIYKMTTEDCQPRHRKTKENRHTYIFPDDWTIKIDGDKLFIIADHICNVIDLNSEAPISIETIGE